MKTTKLLLIATIGLFMGACQKEKTLEKPEIPEYYVVGYEDNAPKTNAISWKLLGETNLSLDASKSSSAEAVFVSDNDDVYIVGSEGVAAGQNTAMLWKNGVPTKLTDGTGDAVAFAVCVSGSNVYAAGIEFETTDYKAKYWKDGTEHMLESTSAGSRTEAYGLAVSGSDVYVAGYETIAGKTTAKIWKNGVATSLSDGTKNVYALSLCVAGADVYVAGAEDNGTKHTAVVWKNGVRTDLSPTQDTKAYSIFVKDNKVYVAGVELYGASVSARLWTDGEVSFLTPQTSTKSEAVSVFVAGGNVYVAGYESVGGKDVATIWENGQAFRLPSAAPNAYTAGIFVKMRKG